MFGKNNLIMIKKIYQKSNRHFVAGLLAISVMGSGALAGGPVNQPDRADSDLVYTAHLAAGRVQPVVVKVEKRPKIELRLDADSSDVISANKAKKIKIRPGLSNIQIKKRKARRAAERKARMLARERVKAAVYTPVITKVDYRTNFNKLYRSAARRFGIPWQILAAIHSAETGQSGNTTIGSYAGAKGPMQFISSTWAAYGVDGDGDGFANIYDVDDAVHSAARYLAANGGRNDIRTALFHYNHANWYVNKVISIARNWGYNR